MKFKKCIQDRCAEMPCSIGLLNRKKITLFENGKVPALACPVSWYFSSDNSLKLFHWKEVLS